MTFPDLIIKDELLCRTGAYDPFIKCYIERGAFPPEDLQTVGIRSASGNPLGFAICYEDEEGIKVNAVLQGSGTTEVLKHGYKLTALGHIIFSEYAGKINKADLTHIVIGPPVVSEFALESAH